MLHSAQAAHAHPSARGPPSGKAPGEVGVYVRPNRLPGILPGEAIHCSRAPEEVARQPEERGPILSRGRRHPPAALLGRVPQVRAAQTEVVGPSGEGAALTRLCRPLRVSC
eukprot:11257570-Alexandrium_andersonii.AAC.1